jgi:hypothetical protein
VVMPNHIHGIIYLLPGDIEFDPDSTWGAGHAGHRQAQRPAPTGNPIAGVGADPRVCPSPRNPGPDLGTMPPVDANQGARIGEPGQTQGSAPTGNRAHAGNPSHTRANSGNPPRVGADHGVCPSSDNARFDHGDPRAQGNGQTPVSALLPQTPMSIRETRPMRTRHRKAMTQAGIDRQRRAMGHRDCPCRMS